MRINPLTNAFAHRSSPDAVPPWITVPPLDRTRSPFTGWTRPHWLAVADQLLDAVPVWSTVDGAQYRLPGRTSRSGVVSDGLEGFARSFLLAAFRIAGAEAGDPAVDVLVQRYGRGLAAGTDPRSAHAWPALTDYSQQIVEAAAFVVALHVCRERLWDTLPESVRDNTRLWLEGAVGIRTGLNNWVLFRTLIQQFLVSTGGRHSEAEIVEGLERTDGWYRGDGWYTDGDGRNFDYYNAFAMHFYPLIWTTMTDDDGGRREVYRQRLREYLETYQYFIGSTGAPVLQGRSLTYRYGMLAPFWLGAQWDATPLTPGQTRRLCSGVLRHFTEHGVPDRSGLLSLGWYQRFLPLTQYYSGPGSPYWAAKGFAGLALAADHPVWTEREATVPQDETDLVAAVRPAGWLLHSTKDDGIVRLINHGSDHQSPAGEPHEDALYAGYAYSNVTSPELGGGRPNEANHVGLLDGGTTTRRRVIEPLGQGPRWTASRYRDTLSDGTGAIVDVVSVLHGTVELRCIRAESASTAALRLSGYALPSNSPADQDVGPRHASATAAGGPTSAVVGLHGFDRTEFLTGVQTSALDEVSTTPSLLGEREPGASHHVAVVALSGQPVATTTWADSVVHVTESEVRCTLPDATSITVTFDADTVRVTRTPPTEETP